MTATDVSPTAPGAARSPWRPGLSRLGGWVAALLVLALISGPDGNSNSPAFGFTHSILRPRVTWFILAAVGLWAVFEFVVPHIRQPLRDQGYVLSERTVAFRQRRPVRAASVASVIAVAVLIPPTLSSYWQNVLVQEVGVFVLLALGLNVVVGFAGLLDLGYIAFFAVGGYLTAFLTGRLPVHPPATLNPFWILPVAVGAAIVAGVLLGAPTLRLRGDYLAIVTLGFGEIVYSVALIKTDWTNGDSGAFNIPHFSIHIGGLHYVWGVDPLPYYWVLLVFIGVVFVVFRRLEHTRTGRAWAAIREDEVAAAASGVPTVRYKLLAFAIGASTSGFAGVLYAANVNFINPAAFVLQQSILVLVLVIFGGMGNMWGVIAGATLLMWLPERLRSLVPVSDRFIYFGLLIILMMIFRPQGLIPSRRRSLEIRQSEAGMGEGDAMGLPKEMQV
jgi:branched-chain amino acid transport system permease protein